MAQAQKRTATTKAEELVDEPSGDIIDRTIALLSASCRHIALLAAWIATCGSLFFSEVLHWTPCELCWFQRILMYPIAIILIIGIMRNDTGLPLYVLPLSLTGMCVSLYHYLLIKTTIFPAPPCRDGVPCTVDYIDILGFINIPLLALTAFTIISIMMGNYLLTAGDDGERSGAIAWGAPASRAQLGVLGVVAVVIFTFIGLGAATV